MRNRNTPFIVRFFIGTISFILHGVIAWVIAAMGFAFAYQNHNKCLTGLDMLYAMPDIATFHWEDKCGQSGRES